jgi:hypothetical protein
MAFCAGSALADATAANKLVLCHRSVSSGTTSAQVDDPADRSKS